MPNRVGIWRENERLTTKETFRGDGQRVFARGDRLGCALTREQMIMSGLEIIGAVMLVAMIVVIGGGLYAHRA